MTRKTKHPKKENKIPGFFAMLPEDPAITAIKRIKYTGDSSSHIDTAEVLEAMIEDLDKIQNGDPSNIERHLYAQAIALNAVFDRMLANLSCTTELNQLQVLGQLALKAQAQSRVTFATLADIRNPNRAIFIKQQNNGINQQINTQPAISEKSENLENELLSEGKHETLDFGGAAETIPAHSAMATMDAVNGCTNTGR